MRYSKYCLLTNDVETHSIWYNCLRDETGRDVEDYGLPALLDIYAQYNIKSTFFFTGYIAKKFPNVVKMVLPYGHEVGCHGLTHKLEDAFDVMSFQKQKEHLRISKQILEEISGEQIFSFRAPALRVNESTPLALAENGFKIDSSIASQRFDMFLSFGGIKKLKWFFAPRNPYRTSEKNLFKKGNGSIIEVPLSAFFYPYIGTTLRISPAITRVMRYVLHIEAGFGFKPIVFDIHPNELLNEQEERQPITRRAGNIFSYLWSDLIRGKLKRRNLGEKAIPLYKREIDFFEKRKYKFGTIRDFVLEKGFEI